MTMQALDSRAELDISTRRGINQIRQVSRVMTFSRYGAIVLRPQQMNANSIGLNDAAAKRNSCVANRSINCFNAINDRCIAPQQFFYGTC